MCLSFQLNVAVRSRIATMPLESGALSTLRASDRFLATLQNAIAFQQNIPITFIRADFPATFDRFRDLMPHDPSDFPRSVFVRCHPFLQHWSAWKKFFRTLGDERYAFAPSYANPAVRLLR